ncbi:hypothetical protein QJS04_geneDACA018042 [Acorus gramineus]|uniref:Uncharacterized protein n=1 Tax=Acorus gramineus TaxID=55184 RepID=A0AAV9A8M2_ACOGR|nr:hypothetical protein QJS04_geneDACA018042 [Acorus gramineus]
MGNCLDCRRSTSWADDDDGDEVYAVSSQKRLRGAEQEEETTTIAKEVKIKITKKQLEELMREVEVQGLPVQRVIEQLLSMKAGDVVVGGGGGCGQWQPALQSIPE